MGESLVDVRNFEDEIRERAASDATLEVSVSFGRYESEPLSWEKWSTFSSNKYLEEVEKCKTPGSVAEKKAYFEAHYKKIAARKAELLDQEKQVENDAPRVGTSGDLVRGASSTDINYDVSNCQNSTEEIMETNFIHVESSVQTENPTGDVAVAIESESFSIVDIKEELSGRLGSPKFDEEEERRIGSPQFDGTVKGQLAEDKTNSVTEPEDIKEIPQEMAPSVEAQHKRETPHNLNSKVENATIPKAKNTKLHHQKKFPKVSTMNKDRNVTGTKMKPASPVTGAKMKPASPVTGVPKISSPRVSKPAPTSPSICASQSSTMKVDGSYLQKSKNRSAGESKRVFPKSLHMSLSLDPTSSEPISPSTATVRKSFIMETMGDKDIVKRAFKTFQNNFNQLKSSVGEKTIPAKVAETRVSSAVTPRKENGGSIKAVGPVKRSLKPTPSYSLNICERDGKQKERMGGKSNAKESERKNLSLKSKEQKAVDIKNLGQNNSVKVQEIKAPPAPGVYRGLKASKNSSDKASSKDRIHR